MMITGLIIMVQAVYIMALPLREAICMVQEEPITAAEHPPDGPPIRPITAFVRGYRVPLQVVRVQDRGTVPVQDPGAEVMENNLLLNY